MSSGGPQQAIGGIPIKSDSFYITTREPSQSMSTAGTVRYVFINTEALEDSSLVSNLVWFFQHSFSQILSQTPIFYA